MLEGYVVSRVDVAEPTAEIETALTEGA